MSSRGRKMQLKLVHAASSGIVVALVLSLLLAPSIWEMTDHSQLEPVVTLEEKGGRVGVEDFDGAPPSAPSPEGTEVQAYPPTLGVGATVGTTLAIIVVVVVLFSFLLVRRMEE